jgi:16S rRNA (guanine966-N2)-methyltransferase
MKPIKKIRVVAGKYKGRKLAFPISDDLRPTKDMVKEGVFSAVNAAISASIFLDLFAGVGSIGIEALSRGANKVTFVDKSDLAIYYIKENLKSLNEDYEIVKSDYLDYLKENANTFKFDIAYLDPPYKEDTLKIYKEVRDANILKRDSIIILESDKDILGELTKEETNVREYKYGLTYIYIIRRNEQ